MTVYITIFNKSSYEINRDLIRSVSAFIDYKNRIDFRRIDKAPSAILCESNYYKFVPDDEDAFESWLLCEKQSELSLEYRIAQMDDEFSVMLLKLIVEKGINDVEFYKNANVSRQTWHKILSDKNYKPRLTKT